MGVTLLVDGNYDGILWVVFFLHSFIYLFIHLFIMGVRGDGA